MRANTLMLLMIVIVLALPSQRCSAADYMAFDLGTLGAVWADACGVNDNGQVAGTSAVAGGYRPVAYRWSESGGMLEMGGLDAWGSIATGINSSGSVVGYSPLGDTDHAFLWHESDGMRDLGTLSGDISLACAINDLGQVVGASGYRAFIWSEATGMVELGGLPGIPSEIAYAINNSGVSAGCASSTTGRMAVIWDETGSMQVIGGLTPEDDLNYARGINDAGDVVGYSGHALSCGDIYRAFIWSSSLGLRDLGVPSGYTRGFAYDINNLGQVAGYAELLSGEAHAVIWDGDGGVQVLPDAPGMIYSHAYAINDHGWVVGWSYDAAYGQHAVLWKPVPEPSGFLALGGGLLAVGLPWMRRRR